MSSTDLTAKPLTLKEKFQTDGIACTRRSCEFSNKSVFCIAKSLTHLNHLQHCLEDFQKKLIHHEEEVRVQTESKLFAFNEKKVANIPHKLESIRSGTTLQVFSEEHNATSSKEIYPSFEEDFQKKDEIQLIAKEQIAVLNNVNRLIYRLEETCNKLNDLLEQEKNRTKMLQEKIDWHAYKRIHDLPAAVQLEHEKCAYNIQELKWHCAYEGRKEQRIREKVRNAENLNKKILEEIEFVKESSPLLTQKQSYERDAMAEIQTKQDLTDADLKEATTKLLEIEQKFERYKRQASQEEKFLSQRLIRLSDEFKITLEKFLKSQTQYESMLKKVEEAEEKLTKEVIENEELHNFILESEGRQKTLEEEVKDLNEKIFQETVDHKNLLEENADLERQKCGKETELENMRKELDVSIQEKTRELQVILKCNKTSQKEIQNLKRRIENSKKQKLADMKAVQRAITEREKVAGDLQVIKEETDATRMVHDKLLLTLDQERERAMEIEDNLSIQVESLKKQNKEENHTRMILQARISADTADFKIRKKEAEKKKEKLTKAEADANIVVKTVDAQVKKLGEKYQERVKAIESLDTLISQLSEKYDKLEENLTGKIAELQPKEIELKEKLSDMKTKENEMERTSELLNKKLKDMASSRIMMNKLLLAHQTAIEELNEEIAELQIQLDSGQGLEANLRQMLQDINERLESQGNRHNAQLKARKQTLADIQEKVDKALKENDKLATAYVEFQNSHIDQKNQFVSTFEKSLMAQDSLSDKKSLCELHSRLHVALKCYYQLRGIQTRAGLSRFENLSLKSNRKLLDIQNGLEVATRNISSFLAANNHLYKVPNLQKQTNQSNFLKVSVTNHS